MNTLEANMRENSTKGQLNAIRDKGDVPAIIYGGKDQNQKVSISKKLLKVLIEKENFLSNIITLNIDMVGMLIKKSKYDDVAPILDKLRNGADKIDKLCNRTTAFVRNEVENPIEYSLSNTI